MVAAPNHAPSRATPTGPVPVTSFLSICSAFFFALQQLASATPSRLKFRENKQNRKKKSTAQHDLAKKIKSIFQFKRLRSGWERGSNRVSAQGPLRKKQNKHLKKIQHSSRQAAHSCSRARFGRQADQHIHIGLIDAREPAAAIAEALSSKACFPTKPHNSRNITSFYHHKGSAQPPLSSDASG